jgi:hypothetical protein
VPGSLFYLKVFFSSVVTIVSLLVQLQHEEEVAQFPDLKLRSILAVDHTRAGSRAWLGLKKKKLRSNFLCLKLSINTNHSSKEIDSYSKEELLKG